MKSCPRRHSDEEGVGPAQASLPGGRRSPSNARSATGARRPTRRCLGEGMALICITLSGTRAAVCACWGGGGGLWTEVCGQLKKSNDPGNNQHILNTPIMGRR